MNVTTLGENVTIFSRKIESNESFEIISDIKQACIKEGCMSNPSDPLDGSRSVKKARTNSSANLTALGEPLISRVLGGFRQSYIHSFCFISNT